MPILSHPSPFVPPGARVPGFADRRPPARPCPIVPPRPAPATLVLEWYRVVQVLVLGLSPGAAGARRRTQRGQATTEYALVLLGAAAVALLFVAWATRTGAIGSLLDAVIASIKRKV